MAKTLRIANKAQTDTYNFLTDNYRLEEKGDRFPFMYGRRTSQALYEDIPLFGQGDPITVLNQDESTLDKMLLQAEDWHNDKLLKQSYWIEWHITGETGRRTLIMPGSHIRQQLMPGVNPMADQEEARRLVLRAYTYGLWESISSATVATQTVSAQASTAPTVISVSGTRPGRIAKMTLEIGTGGPYGTFWIGLRPRYDSTHTQFTPQWECISGVAGTDTSSQTATDAIGTGGRAYRTTFATDATLVQRWYIRIQDVIGSNYNHMRGRYHVLLRYRATTTNASVFGIQASEGYSKTAAYSELKEPIYVDTSDTSWRFAELGILTLPPGETRQVGGSAIGNAALGCNIERLSGSASFDSDVVMLIPADHSIKISGANITNANEIIEFYTHEDDDIDCVMVDTGSPAQNLDAAPTNFYTPTHPSLGGLLVLAAVRYDGTSVSTDTVDITFDELYGRFVAYEV